MFGKTTLRTVFLYFDHLILLYLSFALFASSYIKTLKLHLIFISKVKILNFFDTSYISKNNGKFVVKIY
jgi:hypothetical protein